MNEIIIDNNCKVCSAYGDWINKKNNNLKLNDQKNLSEEEIILDTLVYKKEEKVYYFWKALLEKGIYTIISIAPGVPPGKDLIRTAISASHTDEDLDRIEEAMHYAKSKI